MTRAVAIAVATILIAAASSSAAPPAATVDQVTTTSITLGSLTCGTAYTIVLSNADGSQTINQRTNDCPDTTPPSAPTNLTASAGDAKVSLSWSPSTDNVGVTGYLVFRDGNQVASPTSTSYTDTGLTNGTTYSYTVKAKDAAGNVSAASSAVSATPQADVQPSFPIRAQFFYPWFPETWSGSPNPFTHYHPSLGFYDSSSPAVIQNQLAAMEWGKTKVAIASWWGQGSQTDSRVPTLLAQTAQRGSALRWTLYYEPEGQGNPTVAQISSDLTYIASRYGSDRSFWRVNGKPAIVVYADGTDNCAMADRWQQANAGRFYTVLKVFPGYSTCASQPSQWHQYGPAVAVDRQAGHSYAISPGFWKANEATPRLARDLTRWNTNVRDMVASNEPLQLVTTFNEWGEGTAVESATEWATSSGFGSYLDALHNDGQGAPPPPPPPPPSGDPVVAAAGDISPAATSTATKATSDLLVNTGLSGVLTLGDNQYENGELANYNSFYDPTWGRAVAITHPSPGNHEYGTANAGGYFSYFGAKGVNVGTSGAPYYSWDLGGWHFVSLNSEVSHGTGSAQETWLRNDLAAHPTSCSVAYLHQPYYSSSSTHGVTQDLQPLVADFINAGGDVLLQGHNHIYERFAPQNINRAADANGVRAWVVGTGGRSHYSVGTVAANSVVQNANTYGVLKLTLHASSYDWQFVPAAGQGSFTDSGSGVCH